MKPNQIHRYEVLAINQAGRVLTIDTTDHRESAITKARAISGVVRDRQTGRAHASIHGREAWYSERTVWAARGILGKTDIDREPLSPFAAMLLDLGVSNLPEVTA